MKWRSLKDMRPTENKDYLVFMPNDGEPHISVLTYYRKGDAMMIDVPCDGLLDLATKLRNGDMEHVVEIAGFYCQASDGRYWPCMDVTHWMELPAFPEGMRAEDINEHRIEVLIGKLAASQRREKAAVEALTVLLKKPDDDICAHCADHIPCLGKGCYCYTEGTGCTSDGKYDPDFKWTCEDFILGTCGRLEDTKCNGCFENDYRGFEWKGPQEGGN